MKLLYCSCVVAAKFLQRRDTWYLTDFLISNLEMSESNINILNNILTTFWRYYKHINYLEAIIKDKLRLLRPQTACLLGYINIFPSPFIALVQCATSNGIFTLQSMQSSHFCIDWADRYLASLLRKITASLIFPLSLYNTCARHALHVKQFSMQICLLGKWTAIYGAQHSDC